MFVTTKYAKVCLLADEVASPFSTSEASRISCCNFSKRCKRRLSGTWKTCEDKRL